MRSGAFEAVCISGLTKSSGRAKGCFAYLPYSWVLSLEIFLTRYFRPCPDEIIGYSRTRPRAGGLSKGETARRRTQHNEAPFESDATNSTKGAIIVSEKDNRLFRPTLPPSFSGDSNMRLVVLCTLVFLVSFWLLRSFSPAALLPLRKKPFISSDHGRLGVRAV